MRIQKQYHLLTVYRAILLTEKVRNGIFAKVNKKLEKTNLNKDAPK